MSATPSMINYIDCLFIDIGCGDRASRNAILSSLCHREIKYLDEMTYQEASLVIRYLKDRKERAFVRNGAD